MLRFFYEWVEDTDHWSSELYAIYDHKQVDEPFAWAWDRDDAERIVNLLNEADEAKRRAAVIVALAKHRDQYDLSDLLA